METYSLARAGIEARNRRAGPACLSATSLK